MSQYVIQIYGIPVSYEQFMFHFPVTIIKWYVKITLIEPVYITCPSNASLSHVQSPDLLPYDRFPCISNILCIFPLLSCVFFPWESIHCHFGLPHCNHFTYHYTRIIQIPTPYISGSKQLLCHFKNFSEIICRKNLPHGCNPCWVTQMYTVYTLLSFLLLGRAVIRLYI